MSDACRQVEYPALGRTVLRPTRYRRVNRDDPQPWAIAMIRLAPNYTAEQIRELLAELSPASIFVLEMSRGWNRDILTEALEPGAGIAMSLRQVKYHLAAMCPNRKPRRQTPSLPETKQIAAACTVRDMGWGEYLPLTISEAKILTCLHQFGELSRKALEALTGLRLLARSRHTTPLRRLIRRGLVVEAQTLMRGYALAPGTVRRNMGTQVAERLEELVKSL